MPDGPDSADDATRDPSPASESTLFGGGFDAEDEETGELPTVEEDVIWDEIDTPADVSHTPDADEAGEHTFAPLVQTNDEDTFTLPVQANDEVEDALGVVREQDTEATQLIETPAAITSDPAADEFETMEIAMTQPKSFTNNVISIDTDPVTEKAKEKAVESWTTQRRGERPPIEDPDAGSEDWASAPTSLDDFTNEDYLAATTTEYQGLAEAVRESETQTHEQQAVSATMPGMDSGIVGFEDVTGEQASTHAEEKAPSDLPARVITALLLIGLLLAAVAAGGGWLATLITVIAIIGLGEFYAAARRVGYVPVAAFGLGGVIIVAVSAWFAGPGGIAGAIVVSTMGVLLWYSVLVRRDPLENAAITLFGLVWVGGLLAFAVAITRSESYRGLVVGIVLVAAAMDIGAYFVGRSVGKRKLAPELSPKKTVEGLIGGAASALVVAIVLSWFDWFDPITLSGSLWIALGVIVAAPIGDLAESMVKRSFGIKDMGSVLPGHGGFLDRIDALLFVVPVVYYIYDILGYLG